MYRRNAPLRIYVKVSLRQPERVRRNYIGGEIANAIQILRWGLAVLCNAIFNLLLCLAQVHIKHQIVLCRKLRRKA